MHSDPTKTPKLSNFNPRPICPFCGAGEASRIANFIRILRGKPPYTRWQIKHCFGGKEPQETMARPTFVAGLIEIRAELVLCAGIMEPHLHLTCGGCGVVALMKPCNINPKGWD